MLGYLFCFRFELPVYGNKIFPKISKRCCIGFVFTFYLSKLRDSKIESMQVNLVYNSIKVRRSDIVEILSITTFAIFGAVFFFFSFPFQS